jgi:membrane-associated phospholipid phosphatase
MVGFAGGGPATGAECPEGGGMRRLITVLGGCYVASVLALASERTWPSIPWDFLPGLIFFYIPFSYFVVELLRGLEGPLEQAGRAAPAAAMLVTLLILQVFMLVPGSQALTLGLFGCCVVHLLFVRRELVAVMVLAVVTLFLLYGTVWNLNHLAGLWSLDRLQDAAMLEWDLEVYAPWLGRPLAENGDGLFPLFESRFWFEVMQAGYLMIFCEVFVVVLVLLRKGESLVPFFAVVLTAYVAAVAMFVVYPVVGPYHWNPASLRPEFRETITFQLMTELNKSYANIRADVAPGGYVYVVGLPSLHVAMAMIMQRFMSGSPVQFWAFLPISTLMAVSTCYLGHHYLADALAGVVLGGAVLAGEAAWRWRLPGGLAAASTASSGRPA